MSRSLGQLGSFTRVVRHARANHRWIGLDCEPFRAPVAWGFGWIGSLRSGLPSSWGSIMITEWSVRSAGARGPERNSIEQGTLAEGDRSPPLRNPLPVQWHVLQTRSRQEKAVAEVMHDVGAKPFLPVVRRVAHYGHRRRVVELPVFTNYLFVLGTQEHTYRAINTKRVVRSVPVPDQCRLEKEIEQIRLAIRGEASLSPYRYLERGVRVRVTSGPFKDVEGLVVEDPRGTRLVLQIQALGRATCLEIDASVLQSLDEIEQGD